MFLNMGNTTNAMLICLWGDKAPYRLRYEAELDATGQPTYWLNQNVNNPEFTLGTWHRIEVYLKFGTSATSNDGILKSWLDGTLVMNYSNVNYPYDGFGEIQYAPVWGGVGDAKSETDYFWIDHTHISRP
jgi:hypothetical protein